MKKVNMLLVVLIALCIQGAMAGTWVMNTLNEMEYGVVEPYNYDANQKYPFIITLPGLPFVLKLSAKTVTKHSKPYQ